MKKVLVTTLAATAALAGLQAWAASEKRETGDFTEVGYHLPYEVTFVTADEPYVLMEGDEDSIEKITIEEKGDRLLLKREDPSWFNWSDDEKDVIITIGYVALDAIKMSGSGDGYAEAIDAGDFAISIAGSAELEIENLKADEVSISIAGSGDAKVNNLEADEVASSIAGSGDIELGGEANAQSIKIAGSGDYDAAELRSQEADASISGSGDIVVWSVATLDASIMGSGDIGYYGNPDVSQRVMGSGEISSRGSK